MTKRGRWGCALVILVAGLWLVTGGLVSRSDEYMRGPEGFTFFEEPSSKDSWLCGLGLRLGTRATWHSGGIPFIFLYNHRGAPHRLEARVGLNCSTDSISPFEAIEITEVVAEYGDGERIRKINSWYFKAGPRLTDILTLLTLPRHADVEITLKGNLFKTDGEKTAFDEIGIKGPRGSDFRLMKVEQEDATFKLLIPLRPVSKSYLTTFWADLIPG
jgi:hypothetical protein